MDHRQGRKLGWYGGLLGGTCWLAPLGIVFLWRDRWTLGLLALGLFSVNVTLALALAPWKHPRTRFWKLISPFWAVNLPVLGLILHLEGGPNATRDIVRMLVMLGGLAIVTMLARGRQAWADDTTLGGGAVGPS